MIDYTLAAESICTTASMMGIQTNLKGNMESHDDFNIEDDVIVIIGIIADKKYNVAYSMEKKTAQRIAGAMMGIESYDMDEIGRSAIGELINMISGNIASSFSSDEFDITLPTVIVGNHISCVMQSFESNQLIFETQFGPLNVNFALEG